MASDESPDVDVPGKVTIIYELVDEVTVAKTEPN